MSAELTLNELVELFRMIENARAEVRGHEDADDLDEGAAVFLRMYDEIRERFGVEVEREVVAFLSEFYGRVRH